jgi:hypothetical protein
VNKKQVEMAFEIDNRTQNFLKDISSVTTKNEEAQLELLKRHLKVIPDGSIL